MLALRLILRILILGFGAIVSFCVPGTGVNFRVMIYTQHVLNAGSKSTEDGKHAWGNTSLPVGKGPVLAGRKKCHTSHLLPLMVNEGLIIIS